MKQREAEVKGREEMQKNIATQEFRLGEDIKRLSIGVAPKNAQFGGRATGQGKSNAFVPQPSSAPLDPNEIDSALLMLKQQYPMFDEQIENTRQPLEAKYNQYKLEEFGFTNVSNEQAGKFTASIADLSKPKEIADVGAEQGLAISKSQAKELLDDGESRELKGN